MIPQEDPGFGISSSVGCNKIQQSVTAQCMILGNFSGLTAIKETNNYLQEFFQALVY